MKKILLIAIFALMSSVVFADDTTWEWGASDSAEKFELSMESSEHGGILYSNLPLTNWTMKINNAEEFLKLIADRNSLRDFVADRVFNIAMDLGMDQSKCDSARTFLKKSWVDELDSGFVASYQFAVVFLRFDEDNWFSYDSVRAKIYPYLGTGRKKFRLYKGFNHTGVLSKRGISMIDLPVIIDEDEQTITIWSGELYD